MFKYPITQNILNIAQLPPGEYHLKILVDDNNNNSDSASKQVDEDECVVCLSEPKQVLFLPCRHLCVCKDCLVHVDRCPVCRTPFDEHVLLLLDESVQ